MDGGITKVAEPPRVAEARVGPIAKFKIGMGVHRPNFRGLRTSSKSNRPQIFVCLDVLLGFALGGATPAVSVGMMALHQLLEAGLDLLFRSLGFEPERAERFAFG